MQQVKKFFLDFARDDSGAQVVEYALIIALVSIVLAGALANGGLAGAFDTLVGRVEACFNGNCAVPVTPTP